MFRAVFLRSGLGAKAIADWYVVASSRAFIIDLMMDVYDVYLSKNTSFLWAVVEEEVLSLVNVERKC